MEHWNDREIYGRSGNLSYEQCPFPYPCETIVKAVADWAEINNNALIHKAIQNYGINVNCIGYDNWDGGIWTLKLMEKVITKKALLLHKNVSNI